MLLSGDDNKILIANEAYLLKGFLLEDSEPLLVALRMVIEQSPLRHMVTAGGHEMSVEMTNCGPWGWISDNKGYRYSNRDPVTNKAWPRLPDILREWAQEAARTAGFDRFEPDACLINRYRIGTKLSLHQDKDEANFIHPIVSFSFGLPAMFDFGGITREMPKTTIMLEHGDAIVWGGCSRLNYHGIRPIKPGNHPLLGPFRFNITFRCSQ